jgi:hypothetical protein
MSRSTQAKAWACVKNDKAFAHFEGQRFKQHQLSDAMGYGLTGLTMVTS